MTKKDMDAETLAALNKLKAAVAEGTDRWSGHDVFVGLGQHKSRDFVKAKGGSLDAAKALHDALLPEWAWSVDRMGQAIVWYPFVEGDAPHRGHIDPQNPARAWLIAILKALIAEAEQ